MTALGDHAFCCVSNNKKMAHNMQRDGFARALQRPLALTGDILPTAKLETKKPNTVRSNPNLRPLDFMFNPDPAVAMATTGACPYATVGMDNTIVRPVAPSPLRTPGSVIKNVTAAAKRHLQVAERKKLQRDRLTDPVTGNPVNDKQVIRELMERGIVLIPVAVDPHSRWGPMMQNFHFHHTPRTHIRFGADRTRAAAMHDRATK